MAGLTTLGIIHTAISLVAVAAGFAAIFRHGGISMRSGSGKVYLAMTFLTCLTGFDIFQHGGFGKPHALGVLTTLVLLFAMWVEAKSALGRRSIYVWTLAYSLTLFFHAIPAITETATRLPVGQPWAASPEAPLVQAGVGVAFVLFLLGATVQLFRLRSRRISASTLPDASA